MVIRSPLGLLFSRLRKFIFKLKFSKVNGSFDVLVSNPIQSSNNSVICRQQGVMELSTSSPFHRVVWRRCREVVSPCNLSLFCLLSLFYRFWCTALGRHSTCRGWQFIYIYFPPDVTNRSGLPAHIALFVLARVICRRITTWEVS